MQLEELYDLSRWIQKEIVEANLIQKYQSLHGILNQNVQPNQTKQPFEDQRIDLVESLRNVPLDDLSWGQIELLETIRIAGRVGEEGAIIIDDILYRNAIDVAHAAEELQKAIEDINRGVQWRNKIDGPLSEIVVTDQSQDIGDEVLVRVHFSGDANVGNVTELKDWTKVWYDISRGIAMANDEAPETIRVVGASTGSIIVSLLAGYGIVKTISAVILEALKVADKVLAIRKKIAEIESLQLSNSVAEKALLEEVDTVKSTGIEQITSTQLNALGIDRAGQGDKATALDSAIKKLVDFIEKGGQLDFVLPDQEEDPESENTHTQVRQELRVAFQEIRKIENKVQRIEHDQHKHDN